MQAQNTYIIPVPKDAITKMVWGESKESPAHIDGRKLKEPFGDERNAVDFYCPEGTAIYAAQDGKVVWAKDDSNEGGRDSSFARKANGISILHEQGEYTNYLHLQYKGVNVKKDHILPGSIKRRGIHQWRRWNSTGLRHGGTGIYKKRNQPRVTGHGWRF